MAFSQFVNGHLISLLKLTKKIKEQIGNAMYHGVKKGTTKKEHKFPITTHI
jgi:hypothetical protein